MKDFNAWLGDLTEKLQEGDATLGPQEVQAAPYPCGVCGSTEEVCGCEEEAAGFPFFSGPTCDPAEIHGLWGAPTPGDHNHSITTRGTQLPEPLDGYVSRMMGEKLPERLEHLMGDWVSAVTTERRTAPMRGCIVDVSDLHKSSESLRRELLEKRMAEVRQQMAVPQKYMRETHAMTATEAAFRQREAAQRLQYPDHQLKAYTQLFVRAMERRRKREDD